MRLPNFTHMQSFHPPAPEFVGMINFAFYPRSYPTDYPAPNVNECCFINLPRVGLMIATGTQAQAVAAVASFEPSRNDGSVEFVRCLCVVKCT